MPHPHGNIHTTMNVLAPGTSSPLVAGAFFLISSTWYALSILMFAVDYLLGVLKLKARPVSHKDMRAQIQAAAASSHMQTYMERRRSTAEDQRVTFADRRHISPCSRSLSDHIPSVPPSPTYSTGSSTLVSPSPAPRSPMPPRVNARQSVPCSRVESSPVSSTSSYFAARRPQLPLRLPTSVNMNLFRNKSRRTPVVAKQRSGSDPGAYTATQKLAEEVRSNIQSTPGESYRTTFVNPFRLKPLRAKTVCVLPTADEQPEPASTSAPEASTSTAPPRRRTWQRRSLASCLNVTLNIQTTLSLSPRTRSHSVATPMRESAPRTQPYGAPYFAPMPSPEAPRPRRAASCSPPPERQSGEPSRPRPRVSDRDQSRTRTTTRVVSGPVANVGNALGLSLGSGQEKRSTRHRPTRSDSDVAVATR